MDLDQQIIIEMQNIDSRLIQKRRRWRKINKMARITKIYYYKFAGYFGLQRKPPSEDKRIVTNKGLNFKTRDWLFRTKLKV